MRRGTCGGGGAFAEPIDVGHVVRSGPDGSFTDVCALRNDIVMCNVPTEFEIAVGDGTLWVVKGNYIGLNGGREGLAP